MQKKALTAIEAAEANGWIISEGTLQARGLWHAYKKEIRTDNDVTLWCSSKHEAAKEALRMDSE